MQKTGKATSPNRELTPAELGLIINTAIYMDRYVTQYDFNTEVQRLLRNLKMKHFGIQLFLTANFLNFDSRVWYKPEEIKKRFEVHIGLKPNTKDDLLTKDDSLTGHQLMNRSGNNSRDINKALTKLRNKAHFRNITGTKNIKRVTNQNIQFDGFPSLWKFPNTGQMIRSILSKPKIFKTIYYALLRSGLLYDFWRHNFVTILGVLEEVDDTEVNKCNVVLRSFYASLPERRKNKPSPESYLQQVVFLQNYVKRLNDNDLVKTASKMAGYILKNQPEFSIFGIHLESANRFKITKQS